MSNKIISVKNLTIGYGKKEVLKNISFEIENGSIVVVLGNNGVGKTTLFKCLLKLLKVPNESIQVNGKDINKMSIKEYAQVVSYVPQLTSFDNYNIRVKDFLVQGRTPYLKMFSSPSDEEYLKVFEYAKRFKIENLLLSEMSTLSGGQVQLISIIRSLIQETPIVILDEPLSALDIKNQMIVLNLIKEMKEEGKTIIFSSHNPNYCYSLKSDCLLLKDGSVFGFDKADSILTKAKLNELYDCEFDFDQNHLIVK